MKVNLYDKDSLDQIPWSNTENSALAKQYILPIIKNGTLHFFKNISTDLRLLEIEGVFLPVTINEKVEPNAYVCSTYTHYILYALEEIKHLKSAILRSISKPFIHLFGKFLEKGKVDKTVFVNNWLLPTNLYPYLSQDQIKAATLFLTKQFPDHAIAFRSVNDIAPGNLKMDLVELRYNLLLCRDIYFTDTESSVPFKARMTKSDLKLLDSTDYCIVENKNIPKELSSRLSDLYQKLNIDKYSACNPQYKPELIELLRTIPRFHLKAWIKEDQADAVLGYYDQEGILTSPLFGYDTSLPQQSGLYRQISGALLRDAKSKRCFLHQSSGAGHYKKLRRAEKGLEYTAIYTRHLPFTRQLPWKLLLFSMNTAGKQFIK